MMEQALSLLQKYYGYPSFREGQQKMIQSILDGQDTLGIMPTGGGKSICYQIPALLFEGTTLVISPLISLMKDQVDALHALGIPATYINSSLDSQEVDRRLHSAALGEYKLLYIAPERLESERFVSLLQQLRIGMLAIDEAHCISQWGHDFRPSYLAVARLIDRLPQRPLVAAFTATATQEVTQDIVQLLGMQAANAHITGFNRENLTFTMIKSENKRDYVLDYLARNKDQAGVIYAATRKEVDQLYEYLLKKGYSVGKYHAGMSDEERAKMQDMFLYDDIRIIIATNAFGMGIDKSNVRYVIHYNMPKNMEAYYQEAGRAGRDGEPSECVMLFHPQDTQLQKYLIEQSVMAPERKIHEYKKLQIMVDYCHTTRCLRSYILNYFEEKTYDDCGNCSNCNDDDREEKDITVEAQKIFSCIKRMRERFGVTLVAQVLKGSKNKKVLQFDLHQLPTYGLMNGYTEKEIVDLANVLIAEGYIGLSEGQYPVARLLPRSVPVLQGAERVVQKIRQRPQQQAANVDHSLFEKLRELRKVISQREHVPPYIIFPDSTLREMSEYCPTDEISMLRIKGVGEAKFRTYGMEFLELLRVYAEEHGITGGAPSLAEPEKTAKSKDETPSHLITYNLYREGKTLDEIVTLRQLKPISVQDHLVRAYTEGHEVNWDLFIPDGCEALIREQIALIGAEKLRPLKDALPPEVDYFAIKAVLCKMQAVHA